MYGNFIKRYVTGAVASGVDVDVEFDQPVIVRQITFHFSASTTDTITLSTDEEASSNNDTVFSTTALSGETDVIIKPDLYLAKEDKVNIAITTATTVNVYAVVLAEATK